MRNRVKNQDKIFYLEKGNGKCVMLWDDRIEEKALDEKDNKRLIEYVHEDIMDC